MVRQGGAPLVPTEPLEQMPTEIVHGDSIRVAYTLPDYPVDDGWSANLQLIGPTRTSLSATSPEGTGDGSWLFELSVDSSADDLEPGTYRWVLQVEAASERVTLLSGRIEVLPDPSNPETPVPSDERSFARAALEQLEAAILERKTSISFSVFGRSYTFETWEQMLSARARLRTEVASEEEAERIARGGSSQRVAWVRF